MRDVLARLGVSPPSTSAPHELASRVDVDRDLAGLSQATYRAFLRTYLADYAALDYEFPLRSRRA
jgi:hypothetical protein